MKFITIKSSLLLLLFVSFLPSFAQEKSSAKKNTEIADKQEPKITKKWEAFRVGGDVYSLANSLFNKNHKNYEIQLDAKYGPYILALELGHAQYLDSKPKEELGEPYYETNFFDYSSKGYFYRFGIDYDFIKEEPDFSVFLGARYARGIFKETISFQQDDPYFEDYIYKQSQEKVTGRWVELTGGLKVKVYRTLSLGFTARYKIWAKTDNPDFQTYKLPGFGKLNTKPKMAFNYYLYWDLPFKKKDTKASL